MLSHFLLFAARGLVPLHVQRMSPAETKVGKSLVMRERQGFSHDLLSQNLVSSYISMKGYIVFEE
jgi:hypothetical protein